MRILFLGDIVGRSGREAIRTYLPHIQKKESPDIIIANVENAAHGFGLTPQIAEELWSLGIHVFTTGNHIWDKKEILPLVQSSPYLIRPLNLAEGTPGKVAGRGKTRAGCGDRNKHR